MSSLKISSRHWFVLEPLQVAHPIDAIYQKAAGFEIVGNWYLAGEAYIELHESLVGVSNKIVDSILIESKILARAASCFELAQDSRTSARFYERAAQKIVSSWLIPNPQLAAELYNRAALQYQASSEYFSAGATWNRAAEEFGNVKSNIITCTENRTPLPTSAFKSFLCGLCFEAAAIEFEKVAGNEMWSVGSYWRAGKAYEDGIPNIQAFNAYRRALNAHIRYYGTLDKDQMNNSLPLSQDERDLRIDPFDVMEKSLARCNNHHQLNPGVTPQSQLQTNRQMAEAFHGFNLELQSVGNAKEAANFRIEKSDRQRKILFAQHKYGISTRYLIWKLTSNYSESLGRWGITCFFVIMIFASLYSGFGLITTGVESIDKSFRFFDYIYFSVITFSTLGYGDLHPMGLFGQILACLEVICGLIMFGLLLSLVGSRLQRN
ncbi:potassium channel family protein [Solimicrobium silvestre]|uniref:Ion channel n=1 Tax=Solimicrobium silvestre TaxID=2099400 RepID=A0A2S9GSQ8_9BURK|nr:potassium channel family protein [Solimicrobium silvestre]PRC90754.1 Ion channel [Solimicrobium silvestre]